MADYFVYNRNDPKASTHRMGVRITSTAVDVLKDVVAQYHALQPSAATDNLEIIDASNIIVVNKTTARAGIVAALPAKNT